MVLKSLLLASLLVLMPAQAAAEASLAEVESLIADGKDLAAISMLKEMVKAHPEEYQYWFTLGVTQARKRHYDDAIAAFNRVVQLQPELAEPHNNLAVIYNEMGNLKGAVRELEASLKLNPGYVTAHENIGDLYVKLAARSYKQALSRQENEALRSRYENLLRIRTNRVKTAPSVAEVAAEKQPAKAAVQEDAKDQALAAIDSWRRAWSAKDLDAYFAAYAGDFDPGSRFKSLAEWRAYKTAVISKRKVINVSIDNIVVTELPDGSVKAVFLQHFRSDSFQSDNRKELLLKRVGEHWKIGYEISN